MTQEVSSPTETPTRGAPPTPPPTNPTPPVASGSTLLGADGPATPTHQGTATGVTEVKAPEWKSILPDDLKNDPNITHLKTVEDLAKSYVHGQRQLGADKILIPSNHATEQDWRNVYRKLGCPEKIDDYKLELPEGAVVDEKVLGGFKEISHKAGLNNKQLQTLADWYTKTQSETFQELNQVSQARVQAQEQKLNQEWGQAVERNLLAARTAVQEVKGKIPGLEEFLNETDIDGIPAGDHPIMKRIFNVFGQNFMEDEIKGRAKTITGFTGMSPDDAGKKIQTIMGDNNHPYRDKTHPGHKDAVEEVRKLFQIKHGGSNAQAHGQVQGF